MHPLKIIVFVLILKCGLCQNSIDYFIDLITKNKEKAKRYELPKSASEYAPTSDEANYFGSYDYIVVDAGSAGAVIANRLSEQKHWKILLLEAGQIENDFTDIPGMHTYTIFSQYNWGYQTVPQTTACLGMVNNSCSVPRGKGVGGTSIINGLMYSRPNRLDFDRWANEGNTGWSYEEVLPYFKKSENFNVPYGDKEFHGTNGPLNVEFNTPFSPQLYAFMEAASKLGYNIVDYNGKTEIGVSPVQYNTINGRRMSTGKAFIKPVFHRPNLHVLTNSYVTRILINKEKIAVGVEFTHKNKWHFVLSKNEIVLSAGAIGSAQILQLSGVGPSELLKKHNIKIVQNLPVGYNLFDHVAFYGLHFETNYSEPIRSLKEYVQDYIQGYGPLTVASNVQGMGFFRTPLARFSEIPDIEMMFLPANSTNELSGRFLNLKNETASALSGNSNTAKSFDIFMINLQPLSRGSVKIKSRNPFVYPEIDPRYLSDRLNFDIDTLYYGIELVIKMINTAPFRKLNTKYAAKPLLACKDHQFLSKSYWYCAIRQLSGTLHHPAGTCKMGPNTNKGAVVDNKLRVYGIKKLRVADASVIPFPPASHTNALAILIGEIASDIIKGKKNFS